MDIGERGGENMKGWRVRIKGGEVIPHHLCEILDPPLH